MFCTNPFPRQKIKIRHGTDGKSADGATPGFQYLRSTGSCGCTRRTNLVASKAADRNVRDSIFADREQSCCNKEVYCTRAACSLSIWLVFRFGKTLSIKESVPRYLRSTTLDQCGSMMADCNERQPESSSNYDNTGPQDKNLWESKHRMRHNNASCSTCSFGYLEDLNITRSQHRRADNTDINFDRRNYYSLEPITLSGPSYPKQVQCARKNQQSRIISTNDDIIVSSKATSHAFSTLLYRSIKNARPYSCIGHRHKIDGFCCYMALWVYTERCGLKI